MSAGTRIGDDPAPPEPPGGFHFDIHEARRFLELLDEPDAIFAFQTFTDDQTIKASYGDRDPFAKTFTNTLDQIAGTLAKWNTGDKAVGCFVTVNEIRGRRRTSASVVRVRSVFAELDGPPLEPVLTCELEPHIVVESSPNRYHCYWLVDGLPVDQFKAVQRTIAARFGGDIAVVDPSRVMRLAGSLHRKSNTPFQVRIIEYTARPPHTAEEILTAFPPAAERGNGADHEHGSDGEPQAEIVRRILTGESYHPSLCALAFRYARDGLAPGVVVESLRGIMRAVPESIRNGGTPGRWQARYDQIPGLIDSAFEKVREAKKAEEAAQAGANGAGAQEQAAGPPSRVLCLTPAQWDARDIAPEDHLLGPFSTTNRSQFNAATGIGKTMSGMAIALTMRLGADFLHWKAHREARILYVDGEMPRELIQSRLAAAASWFGLEEPISGGMFVLSREDVAQEMPPLDTPAGRDWLFDFIEKHCGGIDALDFIIFDNIAMLTAASLKEEDGAQAIKGLQFALSANRIGQLWLHHTGLDITRGYGSKMREWWLDTVMVAEELDRPGTDVAFKLTFPKCRRRTPENRGDFEPIDVLLEHGQWSHRTVEQSNGNGTGCLPAGAELCLQALNKAVAEFGKTPPHCTATIGVHNAVTEDQWRDIHRLMKTGTKDAVRMAFDRGSERLLANRIATKWGDWVWLTKR